MYNHCAIMLQKKNAYMISRLLAAKDKHVLRTFGSEIHTCTACISRRVTAIIDQLLRRR